MSLTPNYAFPGPLSMNKSRYLKRVFEVLQDPAIREVTYRKATQTGGSMVSDIWAGWLMRVRPAPMQINMQTDDDAADHTEDRITPLLKSTPTLKPFFGAARRHEINKTEMHFQLMVLRVQGANLANLQSKSVCNQSNDEVVFWKYGGLLKHADNRLTRFGWRKKQFNVSQGGMEDDDFDKRWRSGSQDEYEWPCPKCGFVQPYVWQYNNDHKEPGGMKYEENDTTRPEGVWDKDELEKTVFYECRDCKHQIRDTAAEREWIDQRSKFVSTNQRAASSKWSGTLPAMACLDIPWIDLVSEWVDALDAMKQGDIEPLKAFIQKRLAQSFKENIQFFEVHTTANRDYVLTEETPKLPGEFWEEESMRFMTIDKQLDHYWFVIRAWSQDGRSRMVDYGRLVGDEDLRERQEALGVKDPYTGIDSGFNATEVYMMCCMWGWRALKGEDQRTFVWTDKKNDTKHYRPFSEPTRQEPLFGMNKATISRDKYQHFMRHRRHRYAVLARWSNRHFNDLLQMLKTGQGNYWGIPSNVSETYLEQLDGAQLRRRRNKNTNKETWEWVPVGRRGDHLRDCELQQLVMAAFAGLLAGRDMPSNKSSDEE